MPTYAATVTDALGEGVELNAWNIKVVAVDPEFQRRGVARKLIDVIKSKVGGFLRKIWIVGDILLGSCGRRPLEPGDT